MYARGGARILAKSEGRTAIRNNYLTHVKVRLNPNRRNLVDGKSITSS